VFEYLASRLGVRHALAPDAASTVRRRRTSTPLPDFLIFAAAPGAVDGGRLVLDMHEITPEFYISKYGIDRALVDRAPPATPGEAERRLRDHVLTIHSPSRTCSSAAGLRREKSRSSS